MPTGYTADVQSGKVSDFRTFALRCARQFGACIMQRDDPMDQPPRLQTESPYYADSLAKAQEYLNELGNMGTEEADRRARAEYEEAVHAAEEHNAQIAQEQSRYRAMLDEVQWWVPPTQDHEALKRFMVEQLESSIKFDRPTWSQPHLLSGRDWLLTQTAIAARDVAYYGKELAGERERVASRNLWIEALNNSLP